MTRYDNFLGRVLLDRYTLVSIIGIGECSVVFGAYDKQTEQTVALKMLAPDRRSDTDAVRRFLDEVNVLSLFDHPNIVKILDVSIEDDNKFFVMEYIEGITLKKHILSKGTLSEDEIVFLSRPILSALEAVHSKGIIHSDIKPQNIVIVGSGEIKLMDFGISKTLASQEEPISEVTVGTVQYVSPEQAEGKPLTHLSDIYSFGVMLYEMATGTLPFADEDSGRIAAMHVSSTPLPPSLVWQEVSKELEAVILRSMEKQPNLRQPSASALLAELEQLKLPQKTESKEKEKPTLPSFLKGLHFPSCFIGILCALLLCVLVSLTILVSSLSEQKEHHTFVRIPDFVGETYVSHQAFGLDANHYTFRITYVASLQSGGKILKQSPAPNKIVRHSDRPVEIKLVVSRCPLPQKMPDITYLSETAAIEYLARYGCTVKKVYAPHDYLPNGYVFKTEPSKNQRPIKEITLYISQK